MTIQFQRNSPLGMNHRRGRDFSLSLSLIVGTPKSQVFINAWPDDTHPHTHTHTIGDSSLKSWRTADTLCCQRFNAIWLKLSKGKLHTHTHTHIVFFARCVTLDFQRFPQKLLWNFTIYFCIIFFLFIFPNFFYVFRFSFLLVVCLARILIIGNKFVFNSTTLRTKLKCRNRGAWTGAGKRRCWD